MTSPSAALGRLLPTVNNVVLGESRTITVNSGAIAFLGDANINGNPLNFTVNGKITGAGSVQSTHYQLGRGQTFFNNTANDFTGALIIGRSNTFDSPAYASHTVTIASLADGPGYGNIIFGRGNNSSANSAIFAWSTSALSPLLLNYRHFEIDTSVEKSILRNDNASHGISIYTDLLVSRAGNKTFALNAATGSPDNVFAGRIADGIDAVISLEKSGTGSWTVSAATPTVLTDVNSTDNYEVVSVPFSEAVPVEAGGDPHPAKFMRVVISNES